MPSAPPPENPQRPPGTPTLGQTIRSVAAAFFGVQSRENRERDFTRGKASHFIIIGILMTALFVFTVLMAVKLALKKAGM